MVRILTLGNHRVNLSLPLKQCDTSVLYAFTKLGAIALDVYSEYKLNRGRERERAKRPTV